jgi:hypothetical protein
VWEREGSGGRGKLRECGVERKSQLLRRRWTLTVEIVWLA